FTHLEEFRRLEREARASERGLWATRPVPSASALAAVPGLPTTAAVTPTTEQVYVTRTGTKYHRAGCRHLARSPIPMALPDAAARFGACSVCRPPTLSATSPLPAASASSAPRAAPA